MSAPDRTIISPHREGIIGTCQREDCHERATLDVSTRWHGWIRSACDDHAAGLAEVPTLTACPCRTASLHTVDACPAR